MEGNGRAVCSGSTDLVLCLDYGENWSKKMKAKEGLQNVKGKFYTAESFTEKQQNEGYKDRNR